jgi:hypothetical protein
MQKFDLPWQQISRRSDLRGRAKSDWYENGRRLLPWTFSIH